jgi:virginiamycin B lyase
MLRIACALILLVLGGGTALADVTMQSWRAPNGSRPHDVAPGRGSVVWYAGQGNGTLGRLDTQSGEIREIPLGTGSAPHGVIVGPDGSPWLTDGGLNAIVRVDHDSLAVKTYPLPADAPAANLNTAAFDGKGVLWFTGQSGIYGRLDPRTGGMTVWPAPRGRGPYGITATPDGGIFYASLAGHHIARIDITTGVATVIEPPTPNQGARRVWSDSRGRIWVSEWGSGQVSMHDPKTGAWQAWKLPGERPLPYAVYVDADDKVWLSDWRANAMVRFDPATERFDSFPLARSGANVRQILGRPGEVWIPESAPGYITVLRTR